MTVPRLLPLLALLLFAPLPSRSHLAADEPPKPGGAAWTFEGAVGQLRLSPRDPYLQYVVLQLGRRDNRVKEAVEAVEGRPGAFDLFAGDRGRRGRADLFATFTGALAIQESLQLDTMRGDQPNRPQPDTQPPKAKTAGPVPVAELVGPTVPSHPWEKMLAGKKPDVGPLAGFVPDDFYFAEFRSVTKLHAVLADGGLLGGHIFTQALGSAQSQQTADRIKAQLGLIGLAPETMDKLGVEAVGVTGSDPFLSEGSDVTLLVKGKNIAALAQLFAGKGDGGKGGEHAGVAYTHRSTPDGAVNVFVANPAPDLHVRGNSLPAFKRVLEAAAGKGAKRLGDTAEFKYVRSLMPRGAAEEDGFVYLSDAFIRRLVGPQLKITERRRVVAYTHLRMIGHAALMYRTEFGRAPKSLQELADAKCAPGVFGNGDLAHPDGGTYTLTPDGMSGVCSKYGTPGALTPCVERLVTGATGDEADEYKQFVAEYSRYWRTFFDPIAVRVAATEKQLRLETLVLPLIDNSIYTELARGVGKPGVTDLLPTPRREIGGVWVHFDKQPLIDALGAVKAEGKTDGPPRVVGIRATAEQTRASNDLKQIGIAVHSYHDVNAFPPADITDKNGKAVLSWRVHLLPFLEQDDLYKQFKLDEPWDSDHNKKLLDKIPPTFAGRVRGPKADGKTAYLRPSGKGTAFVAGKKLTFAGITDGTSNTIMAVEAEDAAAVEWTKPADLPFDPKTPAKGLARPAGRFLALMFDASVRVVQSDLSAEQLARAFDPADGQPVNLDGGAAAPPPPAAGGPKNSIQVQNDLKQIGLALHNHEAATGHFPTGNVRDKAGKPLLSWRVAVLPYIEQDQLYRQFKMDEPWDGEHNKKLIAQMPRIFAGNDPALNAAGKTAYLVPSGKNTVSPPEDVKFRVGTVADGLSNTIFGLVADPAAAVEWTRPADLPFDPKDPIKGMVRPGQAEIHVLFGDGSTRRLPTATDPKTIAAMVTPAGGEVIDEPPPAPGQNDGFTWGLLREFLPGASDVRQLEQFGVDLNKLRRFLKDGIGDHVGLHMHDAPRLLDYDTSGLFGGSAGGAAGGAAGLALKLAFGPSSVSIPVRDAKVVDEYLGELDKLLLARRRDAAELGVRWRKDVDFYRFPLANGDTARCVVMNLFGLKWRLYWARVGDGLYLVTRPFILEDLAAAHSAGKRPEKTEAAHAVLRIRPENWGAVRAGYDLGWAEGHRAACHANLEMVANVSRGWNDKAAPAGDPALAGRVARVYGARPFCPDAGTYALSPDGRGCRCSVHGSPDDPRQPAAPTGASATGRLMKSFTGLTAAIRFEDDGLRVVVTIDREK